MSPKIITPLYKKVNKKLRHKSSYFLDILTKFCHYNSELENKAFLKSLVDYFTIKLYYKKGKRRVDTLKKRVGIATLHSAINYGVYLQAYAMQKKVEDFGYDAEIIHYVKRTESVSSSGRMSKVKRLLLHPVKTKKIIDNKIMKAGSNFTGRSFSFSKFASKNFNLTRLCNDMDDAEKIAEKYDAVVCGSDQIWNPVHTDCNPYYFLQFVPQEKRIAYAPSVACEEIPEKYLVPFRDYISSFSSISVRESSGAELVEKITGRKCVNTVDPTLLYDKNFWNGFALPERLVKEPYIFCYFLGGTEIHKKAIDRIEKETGKKVVLSPFDSEINNLKKGEKIYADIAEFLALVRDADFVLTDSFHGVAFSVNFRKSFAAVKRADIDAGRHTRVNDFLRKISLADRIVSGENIDTFKFSEINYEQSEKVLQSWINSSEEYFRNALEKVLEKSEKTEKKNISALPENSCYGCSACANACPENAIEMKKDELGYLYAQVDESKCINCGLCLKKCEVLKENVSRKNDFETECFIGWMRDEEKITKSSSGGMFFALAEKFIEDGAYVAGAVYTDDFRGVKTVVTKDIDEVKKMRGSKYFQSDKGNVFAETKKLLEKGEKVFFSASPCECAALGAFLGKDYENLTTMSYICHGPSAPAVLEKYIEEIEEEYGSRVKFFTTRYKKDGKHLPLYLKADFENGSEKLEEYAPSDLARIFMSGCAMRNSCLNCKFKCLPPFADIYVGDIGGKYYPVDKYNSSGASCVFVSDEKGKKALESIKDRIHVVDADTDKMIQSRNNILFASKAPAYKKAEEFRKNFALSGVRKTAEKMFPRPSKKKLMIGKIKGIIKKVIMK